MRVALCLFIVLLVADLVSGASITRDELNHKLLCAGCEATVSELQKDLYKLSQRPKTESRVRKVLDRICGNFEKGFIIVTDSNGKKTATRFEGNISGSIDMSPQISTDLVEICTHLTEDYYEEFLHAFKTYDVGLQGKICTEISHSCGAHYKEEL